MKIPSRRKRVRANSGSQTSSKVVQRRSGLWRPLSNRRGDLTTHAAVPILDKQNQHGIKTSLDGQKAVEAGRESLN